MPANEDQIVHVSDTALMVAACRAMETARADGLVRDLFAERLAGARGMAIARSLPGLEMMCFGVGIRSRFLDELLLHALAGHAIETVVSVGAGLDTRPWRLELPADLRWIEVDFPAMLDYKSALLASERPKCRLSRVAADLNDASERQAVFDAAGRGRGLMITEGLLSYLPAETVRALATEPAATSGIRYWLLDLASPDLARRAGMDSRQAILNVQAASHLDGLLILEAARRSGWNSIATRTYTKDALGAARARIQALAAGRDARAPVAPPPAPDDPSGVHLLGLSPA
jgi:methyltransferase (TIGR00027 family)